MSEHAQLMAHEIRGPYSQVLVNLSGENGREWLDALGRFLRKENPWLKPDLSILDKSVREIFTPQAVGAQGMSRGRYSLHANLKKAGISTIRDLIERTESEIYRIPNIGEMGRTIIRYILSLHGFHLKGS